MSNLNPYSSPNAVEAPREQVLVAQLVGEEEGMSVEFEQIFEDLLDYHDYHLKTTGAHAWGRVLMAVITSVAICVMLVGLMSVMNQGRPDDFTKMIACGVVGFAFAFALIGGMVVAAQRSGSRTAVKQAYEKGKNLGLLGLRRITINPEFLIFTSTLCQSAFRWEGIEKVGSDAKGLYVYSTALTAYVIPRHAFASDQQFQDYCAKAKYYFDRGQPS
ncbi:YcxB family protein [Anatilimnocola sp. NA78]|uniref:YcxB family protein n=1 Tax=Anatilimnocola sp. NA78 TaxID=3415683 RepID=UPI003CE590AC